MLNADNYKVNFKASIVIPAKNGGEIYKKVLKAIIKQEVDFLYEIIIIDSGSKDDTVSYTKDMSNIYKNIVLVEIDSSEFGHGKTRNLGASIANGEILVFLTQDALPYNTLWLQEMIKPFDISEDIVGMFGKHIAYDDCDIFEKNSLEFHFNNFGIGIEIFKMTDEERYKVDHKYKSMLCFYSNNSSAMRKSIWNKIPYDDVDFAEDQLWAKKIIEKGYSKAYNASALVYHSHNYGFKEMMMRSYDDHKGLFSIYSHIPIKNIFLLPIIIVMRICKDYKYLKTLGLSKKDNAKWLFFSIKKNISKSVGSYFGPKGSTNPFINKLFSRELILRKK